VILHSVRIDGLGCFADAFTAGPFAPGVNLIHAPNGSGKSTLARAVSLVFAEPHRSKSAAVQALRPWGRSLAPEVEIEFEHEGRIYKARKRFLDAPCAAVERKDGDTWTAFAKGDDADDFLRGVLQAGDRPRANNLATMGVAGVLWTTQGDLVVPPLSANVIESIRGSLGAQLSAGGSAIESAVKTEYLKYYTPDRGALRSGRNGAPQLRMEAELEGVANDLRLAEETLGEFQAGSARIEVLSARSASLDARCAELGGRLEKVQALATAYTSLLTQKQVRSAERGSAQAKHKQIAERISTIRIVRERVAAAETELSTLGGRVPELESNREARRRSAAQADEMLAAAAARELRARGAVEIAQLAQEYSTAIAERTRLGQRLQDVAGVQQELRAAEIRKTEIHAPAEQQIKALRRQTERELDLLRRLELARITVSYTPDSPTEIEVLQGELPGIISAAPGVPVQLAGAPALSFRIAGVGRFDASGPVSEYESQRRELDSVRACLVTVKQQHGSADPDELEARRQRVVEAEAAIREANRALSALLAGDTEASLRETANRLAERIGTIEEQHPEWISSAPDAAALRAAADSESESAIKGREEAAVAARAAETLATAADAELERAAERSRTLRSGLEGDRNLLTGSLADGLNDEQRQARLDEAALSFDAARTALAAAEEELAGFSADPRDEAKALESQVESLKQEAGEAARELIVAETRLDGLVRNSPYTGYVELCEQASVLREQLDREQLRMKALSLLYRTLDSARSEAMSGFAVPVEATASRYLEHICGSPIAEIRLTPSLDAKSVIPAALAGRGDDPVSLDLLSGGEQEQVFLSTRLAIGAELARREHQMVVLDDTLICTDGERMERICELLERLSDRLQFLVLTCHPERFASLRGANHIHVARAAALYAGAVRG
jgi:hypothetical protein